jgi:carbonic anhydrase
MLNCIGEHTLDGDHEEMELHLVHQAADGSLAVVGIFFREGKQNPFLAQVPPSTSRGILNGKTDSLSAVQFWDELSGLNVGEASEIQLGMVDTKPLELLSGGFYRYRGSLTTPPYSEGVEWVVVRDIAHASREQLDAFRQVLPGTNARDVQPLNKRDVALVH